MSNIQVGQKIYITRPHRNTEEPKEVTVSKVGRQYFEVEEHPRLRFYKSVEKKCSKTEIGSPVRWYFSLQEYEDEKQHSVLCSRVYQHFSKLYSKVGTLEQIKQVCEILGIDTTV